jgi:hypothetical protein
MLGELAVVEGVARGLDLEPVGEPGGDAGVGTERPLLEGWLVNVTICSDDSPALAARIASSSDRSMRSNTASIDDVTRFSPCR